jgi:hypothetical protein
MPELRFKRNTNNGTVATADSATPVRKPSEQALEYVDVTFGLAPSFAEAVRKRVEQLRDPSTREQELKTFQAQVERIRNPETRELELQTLRKRLDGEVEKARVEGSANRKKVTKQLVDQAQKARRRVEETPVYRQVEPVYKKRVEPVYRKRVEPVYKQRVEPTVKKVAERV